MTSQDLIVVLIVGAAAGYLALKLRRLVIGRGGCGCGGPKCDKRRSRTGDPDSKVSLRVMGGR